MIKNLIKIVFPKKKKIINHLNDSAHPRSLIKSIPYSQNLCLKSIRTKASKLLKNLSLLKELFMNQDFNEKFLNT